MNFEYKEVLINKREWRKGEKIMNDNGKTRGGGKKEREGIGREGNE